MQFSIGAAHRLRWRMLKAVHVIALGPVVALDLLLKYAVDPGSEAARVLHTTVFLCYCGQTFLHNVLTGGGVLKSLFHKETEPFSQDAKQSLFVVSIAAQGDHVHIVDVQLPHLHGRE